MDQSKYVLVNDVIYRIYFSISNEKNSVDDLKGEFIYPSLYMWKKSYSNWLTWLQIYS